MTHDDDTGGGGPYQGATNRNTGTDWLNNITSDKDVTASLTGMSDYAKALVAIGTDMMSNQQQIISQLGTAIEDGAFDGGFPEVSYAAQMHDQNLGEFVKYLAQVVSGVTRTGNAAQAVADSYGDSDSLSSVSLNAVNFAFAEPGATRPAGLPKWYAQTTFQALQDKQDEKPAPPGTSKHPDAIWTPMSTTMNADGLGTTTYIDQYGEKRTMTVTMSADGHKITTQTDPDGTKIDNSTTYSYPLGTLTSTTDTTTTGTGKNKVTKVTTSETSVYSVGGNTTVTDVTDGGVLKSETTTTYNDDGTVTETDYSYDSKGVKTLEQQMTVGQDPQENRGTPASPDVDALKVQKSKMPTNSP